MPNNPSHHGGDAPPDDVEMEDMTDLTEALPQGESDEEQMNDAHDENTDDTNVMSDVDEEQPTGKVSSQSTERKRSYVSSDEDDEDEEEEEEEEANTDDEVIPQPELFEVLFAGKQVELKDLKEPSIAKDYPLRHRKDIISAYLKYTQFTVPVWVNFDAAEQVFFDGSRADACGKLRIPDDTCKWLASISSDVLTFQHVRFDICTPFRKLANVKLDIVEEDGQPARLRAQGHMAIHAEGLRDWIKKCMATWCKFGSKNNIDALTFDNLSAFAACMRRPLNRNSEGLFEQPAYGGGEWAGVEEPEPEPVFRSGFNNLRSSGYNFRY
ncbi:hypothetical protein Q7P37_005225 [Cladosporium fusiforme]